MAWANRESAEEALKKASALLSDYDTAGAARWVQKSLSLFETEDGRDMDRKVKQRAAHEAEVRRVLDASDFFVLLEIQRDATQADIKRAYMAKAKELHPDKNGAKDAGAAFNRVNEANNTLRDAREKEIYVQKNPARASERFHRQAPPMGPQPQTKHSQQQQRQRQYHQEPPPSKRPQPQPPPPPPQQQKPPPEVETLRAHVEDLRAKLESANARLHKVHKELETTQAAHMNEVSRSNRMDAAKRAAEEMRQDAERWRSLLEQENARLASRAERAEREETKLRKEGLEQRVAHQRREADLLSQYSTAQMELAVVLRRVMETQQQNTNLTAELQKLRTAAQERRAEGGAHRYDALGLGEGGAACEGGRQHEEQGAHKHGSLPVATATETTSDDTADALTLMAPASST